MVWRYNRHLDKGSGGCITGPVLVTRARGQELDVAEKLSVWKGGESKDILPFCHNNERYGNVGILFA